MSRKFPAPPRPSANLRQKTDDAHGSVHYVLGHPVRRWIVTHAAQTGTVTSHDVFTEWPGLRHGWNMTIVFGRLLSLGYLTYSHANEHRQHVYTPGPALAADLTTLRADVDSLLAALSPTQEAHSDEPEPQPD